jgi:lactoylglutathione lyase
MRIHHFAIEVKDISKSKAFYEDILGIKEHQRVNFNQEVIIFLELDGFKLELIENKQTNLTDHVHLCFETENLPKLIKKLELISLIPEEGPYELENDWKTVFYRGPDNEVVEFLQTIPRNRPQEQNA